MPLVDYINPYAYLMQIRRMMYERGWKRSYHVGVPVISVGNLSLGGTGKSPVTMLIAKYLEEQHHKRVAIVSRGYRRKSKGYVLVRDGSEILTPVEKSGDEAQMFAEALPNAIVIVDEDRVRGAREAVALGAQVIILDDGFQHLRLQRDLDVVLWNGPSPVIPFGRFREPVSAIHAADFMLSTGPIGPIDRTTDAIAAIRWSPHHLTLLASKEETALQEIAGKRVLALSSIASPDRFHAMLRELGADITVRDLGDHAEYSEALVTAILNDAKKNGIEAIVTTLKDAVKAREYFRKAAPAIPVLVLHHSLEFLDGERGFYAAIDTIL